jgi:hypothetical protein
MEKQQKIRMDEALASWSTLQQLLPYISCAELRVVVVGNEVSERPQNPGVGREFYMVKIEWFCPKHRRCVMVDGYGGTLLEMNLDHMAFYNLHQDDKAVNIGFWGN